MNSNLNEAALHGSGAGQETGHSARRADSVRQPEADTGHDYPMPSPRAENATQFCQGLIGPATLSVAASQIAVEKADDAGTRQFANFELREALAVTAILKERNVAAPPLSADGLALLEELKTTPAGAAFDRIYILAERANHEFLRDLAESYLNNATESADAEETSGRHLAMLALTAFKEHVVLTKDIAQTLGV